MIDAMEMFPSPTIAIFSISATSKTFSVDRFGIDDGFNVYREQLSPKKSIQSRATAAD